jgi:hypothetical protein
MMGSAAGQYCEAPAEIKKRSALTTWKMHFEGQVALWFFGGM